MEMLLPFAGFYCSVHDAEIDDAHEKLAMDGNGNEHDELRDLIYDSCDWSAVCFAYAKEYAEQFARKFGIAFTYKVMESPREYNFTTDRIFVEIELNEAVRLWNNIDHKIFCQIAKEKFTSRDGFFSSYSPDWNDWGSFKDWDHNQLGTVLEAYIASQEDADDDFDEMELMRDAQENGKLDEWIFSNMSAEGMEKYNQRREQLDKGEEFTHLTESAESIFEDIKSRCEKYDFSIDSVEQAREVISESCNILGIDLSEEEIDSVVSNLTDKGV